MNLASYFFPVTSYSSAMPVWLYWHSDCQKGSLHLHFKTLLIGLSNTIKEHEHDHFYPFININHIK